MHAISSYRGNRSTNTPTNKQTRPITIHCTAASLVRSVMMKCTPCMFFYFYDFSRIFENAPKPFGSGEEQSQNGPKFMNSTKKNFQPGECAAMGILRVSRG